MRGLVGLDFEVDWGRLEELSYRGVRRWVRLCALMGLDAELVHRRMVLDDGFRRRWEGVVNLGRGRYELELLGRLDERSRGGDVGATVHLLRRLDSDVDVCGDVSSVGRLGEVEVEVLEGGVDDSSWEGRSLLRRYRVLGVGGDGEVEEG